MSANLFLIDAIGPFFRGIQSSRINWSKIHFNTLSVEGEARTQQWQQIRADLAHFAHEVTTLGYNAVTLDDLAHLTTHPAHEPEIAARNAVFRQEFTVLFDQLQQSKLRIFLTSDVLPLTPAVEEAIGHKRKDLANYYCALVEQALDDFPQLEGIIIRIGESDGIDVKDQPRTHLYLRSAPETNALLKQLLPIFEARNKKLILRTWTVGAHHIGDLIWHRETLARTVRGIDSDAFILSMKHGESDFFRHLPLNKSLLHYPHKKIIELQARREYEGAGEIPSYIGQQCEDFAKALNGDPNLIGVSVWCQTGGWHRFRRLTFLPDAGDDTWIRLNCAAAIATFRDQQPASAAIQRVFPDANEADVTEFLQRADSVLNELLYIQPFASQKLFFRRVRIPPLLHLYWDSLFINHAVRKVLRHFVPDPELALQQGEQAFQNLQPMIELAERNHLPVDDVRHLRDFCELVRLARRYYFEPFDEAIITEIRTAKKTYKRNWPSSRRQRYRIKVSFEPFKVKRHTLRWLSHILLRKRRGYRLIDQIFTLHLLSFLFWLFKPRKKEKMPKFLRESAMGVDVLFK
ncbi:MULTISPECIES: hypothetical protein [unclassified Lentimonas]|uniref:hypothetical protein n=1 Tax=unclassified Lentimonas TaxID=2630993 RepID=UPI001322A3F6|nr:MULTISPECIES: hypothetical protein [unclassified Lentimonas]CAA6677041.1 Unannotated [Lentimonas sp. CC4]CAA6687234.1 Unannotated [Lentimonas sp. CC6]CAA7074365.1 Unannotated [Lentimonas sp. CC4]CAA7171462.1 Unannotated [Lentimonas sp. CC21]CAA7180042.1 Unannotated [Lentimonas sp. CC8]